MQDEPDVCWSLPAVAKTGDGDLDDINSSHVTRDHVLEALESAASDPVKEGNVRGCTGMICHAFKGGIGSASRQLSIYDQEYSLGVLVQANHGSRQS